MSENCSTCGDKTRIPEQMFQVNNNGFGGFSSAEIDSGGGQVNETQTTNFLQPGDTQEPGVANQLNLMA